MKFTNTKQNLKAVGKDIINLTKDTLHIPVSIHKDFSAERACRKAYLEWKKAQETTPNAQAREDNEKLTHNVKKKEVKENA